MNLYEWLLEILKIAILPGVLIWVSHKLAEAFKTRELDAKYVELAIGVLATTKDTDDNKKLRRWANIVLKKYSPIPIPEDVVIQLGTATLKATGGKIGVVTDEVELIENKSD